MREISNMPLHFFHEVITGFIGMHFWLVRVQAVWKLFRERAHALFLIRSSHTPRIVSCCSLLCNNQAAVQPLSLWQNRATSRHCPWGQITNPMSKKPSLLSNWTGRLMNSPGIFGQRFLCDFLWTSYVDAINGMIVWVRALLLDMAK